MPRRTKLIARREAFCREYVKDLNATQAAIRAGYSKKTAQEQSARLLSFAMVRERVAELRAKAVQNCEIKAEAVVEELRRVAFADPRKVAKWGTQKDKDGKIIGPMVVLLSSDGLSDEAAAAVCSVGVGRFGPTIKMHDKLKALSELAEYLGLHDHANREGAAQQPPALQINVYEKENKPKLVKEAEMKVD